MSGWINCKEHGGQPPIHLCSHAYKLIKSSIPVEVIRFPIFGNNLCLTCYETYVKGCQFENYHIDDLDRINDEDFDKMNNALDKIDKIDKIAGCSKCLDISLLINI